MAATATTTSSSSAAAEETAAREWAWLPCNVLDSVLSHLISLQDYLRFTSVCKPWNSTAQSHIRRRIATSQNQPPLLLVPTQNRSCRRRSLYSAAANKLLINQTLQIPYHRRCCGSSHGWLAFLGKDYFVTLYNPFTKARIFLPQIIPSPDYIKTFVDRAKHNRLFAYDVKKLILSADPSISPDDDFIVAAILSEFGTLAVMRAGEKEWKHIGKDLMYSVTGGGGLKDIVFRGDHGTNTTWVCGCGSSGSIVRVDVTKLGKEQQLRPELVAPPWVEPRACVYKYLVESSDGRDLLMIFRFYEKMEGYEFSMATRSFKVFKLRDDEEGDRGVSSRFVEVKDLNGDAVFVGDNYSTAVRAREFEGVRSDSVYFTGDFSEFNFPDVNLGPHDVGVFNVKEKKFGSFYVPTPTQNRDMPPPIWIFPTIAPDNMN